MPELPIKGTAFLMSARPTCVLRFISFGVSPLLLDACDKSWKNPVDVPPPCNGLTSYKWTSRFHQHWFLFRLVIRTVDPAGKIYFMAMACYYCSFLLSLFHWSHVLIFNKIYFRLQSLYVVLSQVSPSSYPNTPLLPSGLAMTFAHHSTKLRKSSGEEEKIVCLGSVTCLSHLAARGKDVHIFFLFS